MPLLVAVERTILDALSSDLPRDHRLKLLENAKREEKVVHILTHNAAERTEPLLPGLDDKTVWNACLGRDPLPSLTPDSQQLLSTSRRKMVFRRLERMPMAKFLDRRVLMTEAGFVGIDVRQIEQGDVVIFPFGANSPLVLRPRGDKWAMVGCAYVAGLMQPGKLRVHLRNEALPPMEFNIC